MSSQALETLLAKQSIRDVLSRYCRGIDRMDKAMADSVFHQDSTVLYYGIYEGSGRGFIDWVWESHSTMACHSHQINNVLSEVDRDKANSEAYVTVALWWPTDENNKRQEALGRGRYLDRWSRRDGIWAIEHRSFVLDMQTITELESGEQGEQSRRDKSDPSFALFPTTP